MNTSQLAIEEKDQITVNQSSTHGYNLRERPTGWKQQISLAVAEENDKTTGVGEKRQ